MRRRTTSSVQHQQLHHHRIPTQRYSQSKVHSAHLPPLDPFRTSKWRRLGQILTRQFKYFFNLYFLLVALSQLIPALKIGSTTTPCIHFSTPGYIFTYFAPLAFVLSVTVAKEAMDDVQRCRRDAEANSQKYTRLSTNGTSKSIPSTKISVGDLIVVHKDQRVPADMILLRTTEKSGACFIRTDQLDGETDW